jgi:hypothetical protein
MSAFSISAEWISPGHRPEEIGQTSALLTIKCGDHFATRNEDEWSRSVHSFACLSCYPLALWFAACWWRLRWEPTPNAVPSVEWRMAHELPAAGYGFLWPTLAFDSDGESIVVACRPTDLISQEPVRYLERFTMSVDRRIFEKAIGDFVNLVVARLSAVGIHKSELHAVWREVIQERGDPEMSFNRRVEAGLGFDPGEAPQGMLENFRMLSQEAGEAASFEIALALPRNSSEGQLRELQELARSTGIAGEIQAPAPLLALARDAAYQDYAPWERGWLLARRARSVWGLHLEPMSDAAFSEILGADITKAANAAIDGRIPIGVAVRSRPGSDHLKFHFRRSNYTGRRFEAARLLADHLLAPSKDRWLPETDVKTARQKIQRAFAAEFLCPIEGLRGFLDNDFSGYAIENAGFHFGVSPLAVRSHLANNGVISPDSVIE